MLVRHFYTPGLAINSYLVFDEEDKRGAVIDPTREVEVYIARAMQEGVEITDIFETHVHADFLSGAKELKAALGNKPVIHCSGMGGKEWIPSYADHIVQDREEVSLGSLRLQAWHTPGHTPEHVMWLAYDDKRSPSVPEIAFTGDLIFVGSIGRPDLLGAEVEEKLAKQLYATLFQVIHPLPEFLEVYPAHGAGSLCGKAIGKRLSTTLGYEKRCNPGLIPQPFSRWLEMLRQGMPPSPSYFSRMKQQNLIGPLPAKHEEMPLPIGETKLKSFISSNVIVDLRNPVEFASGNFEGSINISLSPSFPLWAGIALPADKELLLVVDHPEMVLAAVQALRFVGLDSLSGFIDLSSWSQAQKNLYLKPSPMIDEQTLHKDMDKYYVLDVRTQREWDLGHIHGAHHIELTNILKMMHTIPDGKPVVVVCHSGSRASIVASLLAKGKRWHTFNLKGGMQAWEKARLPVS